jgi:hypothetical protein
MSLPAGQQRVLDEIGDRLRASEPRLAGMFSIFTRLNLGEPRPRREELELRRGLLSLMASPPREGRTRPLLRADGRARGRFPVLALIACHIAVALAVAGLLIGLGARSAARACTLGRNPGVQVTRGPSPGCRAQAGPLGYSVGSK